MLLRKALTLFIVSSLSFQNFSLANTTGSESPATEGTGNKKIIAKFAAGTTPPTYPYTKTNSEIVSCKKDDVQAKITSCNTKTTSCTASAGTTGMTDASENQMATSSACEAQVQSKNATCEAFTTKAMAECQNISAAVKEEVNTCITAGSQSPTADITAAETEMKTALAANNEPGYEAAHAKKIKAEKAIAFNTAECKKVAAEAVKEEKSLLASLGLTKKEAIMLGLGAIAGLGAMALLAKKSKEETQATAATPTPATAAAETTKADAACNSGDLSCLCASGRQKRPVACDRSCPMTVGRPDSSCLASKYGTDWANSYFDPDGKVVNDPNYDGASQVGATTNTNSVSSASTGTTNAYRRSNSGSNSGLTSGANSETGSARDSSGTSLTAGGISLSDSSRGGGSSSEFGGTLNPNSPYASGLPGSATSASRDPERAQLASSSSNNFTNVSRVYRRYAIDMMAP